MDKYNDYLIYFQLEIFLHNSSVNTLGKSSIEWHPMCFKFIAHGLFLSLEIPMLH